MALRESITEKIEAQIQALEKHVDAEKAKAEEKLAEAKSDQAEAEVKEDVRNKVHQLQARIDEARNTLKEVKEVGEDKLQQIGDRIKKWAS